MEGEIGASDTKRRKQSILNPFKLENKKKTFYSPLFCFPHDDRNCRGKGLNVEKLFSCVIVAERIFKGNVKLGFV